MGIKFDAYETPSPGAKGKTKKLHARVLNKGTVSTKRLAAELEHATSLTAGDLEAVLTSLSYLVKQHLSEGERVHIEGLGYFQLSVTSASVEKRKELRGDMVKFKTVKFLPEKQLKDDLSTLKFTRDPLATHSIKYSVDRMERLLDEYFESNPYITRSDFQKLGGLTKSMALKWLRKLVEQGILKKGGIPRFPIYEKVSSPAVKKSEE